jgi:hypothetical protein
MIEILNNDKERWSKVKELMLSKKQLKVYVCKEKFEPHIKLFNKWVIYRRYTQL